MELEKRYLVLKWSDITPALTPEQKVQLAHICDAIAVWRSNQGKPQNTYVVINQDEPYFPAVLALMETHQNKKSSAAETAQRRSQGARDVWAIRRGKQEKKG